MNQKSKKKEKLEDMSNEELYKLQDGFHSTNDVMPQRVLKTSQELCISI